MEDLACELEGTRVHLHDHDISQRSHIPTSTCGTCHWWSAGQNTKLVVFIYIWHCFFLCSVQVHGAAPWNGFFQCKDLVAPPHVPGAALSAAAAAAAVWFMLALFIPLNAVTCCTWLPVDSDVDNEFIIIKCLSCKCVKWMLRFVYYILWWYNYAAVVMLAQLKWSAWRLHNYI